MDFDYAVNALKGVGCTLELEKGTNIFVSDIDKKITELQEAIELLENTQKLNYKHILEVIGIIQNDCAIIDSDKDITISELRICLAHIAGLCNGLTRVINYKRTIA